MEVIEAKIVLDNDNYRIQDLNDTNNYLEMGTATFKIQNVKSNNTWKTQITTSPLPNSLDYFAVHSFRIEPEGTVGTYGKHAITIGEFTAPSQTDSDYGIMVIGTADIADIGEGGMKTIYHFADLNMDEDHPEVIYIKCASEIPDTLLVFSLSGGTTDVMKIRHE